MNLAVGAVVSNRAWILPRYFEFLHRALEDKGFSPYYVFLYGPSIDDTETELFRGTSGCNAYLRRTEESQGLGAARIAWSHGRIQHMTEIRNELLGMVRELDPDYFLSIDSDILLHEDTLPNLLETIEDVGAVGGKLYMSRSVFDPSYANLSGPYGGLLRTDESGVFPVDVIMALKLMSREAYNVDYAFDPKGEDIGWSTACRSAGLTLKWDGRVTNKHVLRKESLDEVDPRCGY